MPRGWSDKLGTSFGRPAPKNLGGQKIVQNSARFLKSFDIDREYLRNAKVVTIQPLPRWVKKDAVLWSINEKVIESNVYGP